MKRKRTACKYCATPLDPKTTRREFCSDKCRVYWNRENSSSTEETLQNSDVPRGTFSEPNEVPQNNNLLREGIQKQINEWEGTNCPSGMSQKKFEKKKTDKLAELRLQLKNL